MPEMPPQAAPAAAPAAAPPAPAPEAAAPQLEGMPASELMMLGANALAIASTKVVDEFAGQGDLPARLAALLEEAAAAVAQAMEEVKKGQAGAAPEGGAAPAPPAPPAPEGPPQG